MLRKIKDRKSQQDIRGLLEEEKTGEMLEYIRIYADSVENQDEEEKNSKKVGELLKYVENNKQGLLPYDRQGVRIPESVEGILYKHMGVQESQNCMVITVRMKHRRMRWSMFGANNLAKALYRENKELVDTIERYTDSLVFTMQISRATETLSAARAPKRDGKGNRYAEKRCHMLLLDAMQTASRKAFKRAFAG